MVQYLNENGMSEYTYRITSTSIGAYRGWFKEMCEPLIQYGFILHNGAIHCRNNRIGLEDLRVMQAGIKTTLLDINLLVNRL